MRVYLWLNGSHQIISPVLKPIMTSMCDGLFVIWLTSWHRQCPLVKRILVKYSACMKLECEERTRARMRKHAYLCRRRQIQPLERAVAVEKSIQAIGRMFLGLFGQRVVHNGARNKRRVALSHVALGLLALVVLAGNRRCQQRIALAKCRRSGSRNDVTSRSASAIIAAQAHHIVGLSGFTGGARLRRANRLTA